MLQGFARALALLCLIGLSAFGWAAKPEKLDVTIAVGGKSSLYYLPMALADRLGYFKAEGLNVEIAGTDSISTKPCTFWPRACSTMT